MKTDELESVLADLFAEHIAQLRVDIERMIDAKALPPFVPPPVWTLGRHGAGAVVRHKNGLFSARRDTEDEPPTDAWLPLLVGIAGVDFRWSDDRTMQMRVMLSDGTVVETEREFTMPIARGLWSPDSDYREADRVVRFGDWQALKPSKGIDPHGDAAEGVWVKVTGKSARVASFKLDDDGTMFEGGHRIGSIKPLVSDLLRDLVSQ